MRLFSNSLFTMARDLQGLESGSSTWVTPRQLASTVDPRTTLSHLGSEGTLIPSRAPLSHQTGGIPDPEPPEARGGSREAQGLAGRARIYPFQPIFPQGTRHELPRTCPCSPFPEVWDRSLGFVATHESRCSLTPRSPLARARMDFARRSCFHADHQEPAWNQEISNPCS